MTEFPSISGATHAGVQTGPISSAPMREVPKLGKIISGIISTVDNISLSVCNKTVKTRGILLVTLLIENRSHSVCGLFFSSFFSFFFF